MEPSVNVLAKQEQSSRFTGSAKLVNLLNNESWDFLYNPESIAIEYTVVTAESPVLYADIQPRVFTGVTGDRHSFSNLILSGWCEGKTVEQAIASFRKLSQLDPDKKEIPTLLFQWGSKKIEPCILDGSVSIQAGLFLESGIADARLSFSLVRVPPAIAPEKEPPPASPDEINLTDRQRADARTAAGKWLQENIAKIKPDIRDAIQASQFAYLTTTDGSVSILIDGKNYKIGSYNGQDLNTENNEVIGS